MFGRRNGVAATDCAPRIVETIVSMGLNGPDGAPPSTGSHFKGRGKVAENGLAARKVLKIVANVAFIGAVQPGSVLAPPDAVKVGGAHGGALGAAADPGAGALAGRSCDSSSDSGLRR
jgi:hypothetical protein